MLTFFIFKSERDAFGHFCLLWLHTGYAEILLNGYKFEILAKGLYVVKEALRYQRNWSGYLQKMVNAFNVPHSVSGENRGIKITVERIQLSSDLYSLALKRTIQNL
jgi:hypothetical protein